MIEARFPKSLTELKTPIMFCDVECAEIIIGLHVFFNDTKKIVKWLKTKNPNFGNVAPLKLMQLGKGEKVLSFINDALDPGEHASESL